MVTIDTLKSSELIRIVDVSKIRQGDLLWSNGDTVEIKKVDISENRIEVWNRNKDLSELIYVNEFEGIIHISEKEIEELT